MTPEDASAEDLANTPATSIEKRVVGIFFSFLCTWVLLAVSGHKHVHNIFVFLGELRFVY